jgi:N-terminal domain of ribose phosphate pyrophosphokinase
MAGDMVIFGGSGSPKLTRNICDYLKTQPGAGEVLRFSDGNLFVRVKENVRGRQVYLVQSTVFPTNDNFMELLFWIDAFKRASARSVTVVMPYLSAIPLHGDVVELPNTAVSKIAGCSRGPWAETQLSRPKYLASRRHHGELDHLDQRFCAVFCAIPLRCSGISLAARAFAPIRPISIEAG